MVNGLALSGAYAPAPPKGEPLAVFRNLAGNCQCLSLWERWHGVSRDGEGEPPLLLVPDGHAAGVGVQALALGKIRNAGGHFAQRFAGVVEEAGLLYKVVHAQGA